MYDQALFDSYERHSGKPFKSQLHDLLCLDKVLTPHCFQVTQLTGSPKDGMYVALEAQQEHIWDWLHKADCRTAVGMPALRANLLCMELPNKPNCAGV